MDLLHPFFWDSLYRPSLTSTFPAGPRYHSAGWSSASPRGPTPHSGDLAPPVAWSVSSPTTRSWPVERSEVSCSWGQLRLETHLWYKESWPGSVAVPDCRQNVHCGQSWDTAQLVYNYNKRMYRNVSPVRGWMLSKVLPKVSWKM